MIRNAELQEGTPRARVKSDSAEDKTWRRDLCRHGKFGIQMGILKKI